MLTSYIKTLSALASSPRDVTSAQLTALTVFNVLARVKEACTPEQQAEIEKVAEYVFNIYLS